MPDLGKYTDTVLSAYAVSILLILVLVGMSLWRAKRVRAQLEEIEKKVKNNG